MRYIVSAAVGAIGILLAIFVLGGLLSWDSTDVDEIGLHYSGGPVEGRKFEKIVPPSTSGTIYGPLDTVEKLPANQRTYTISKVASESDTGRSDFIGAANSEGVEIEYETSTYFELNRDPEVLREFYEKVCTKYDGCQGESWNLMLNDNLRKAQETTLQNVSRQFSTDELRLDDGLPEIQRATAEALQESVNSNLGGPYFTISSFQINDNEVPPNIAKGYSEVKAEELRTQAAAQRVDQAEQQANAAEELAATLENNPGYLELREIEVQEKAVEQGQVPVLFVPEGSDLLVDGSGANGAPR